MSDGDLLMDSVTDQQSSDRGARAILALRRTRGDRRVGRGTRVLIFSLAYLFLLIPSACGDPKDRLASHMERGAAYLEAGDFAEAAIEYRNAVQIDDKNGDARFGLARAYVGTREPAKAYWEFRETVRLAPDNLDARQTYASFLLYGDSDQREDALKEIETVLESDPERVKAWAIKGRIHRRQGQLNGAEEAFQRVIELAPDEPQGHQDLGVFFAQRGKRDKALVSLKRYLELQPDARAQITMAAFFAGDPDEESDAEAETSFQKALELAKDGEKSAALRRFASFYFSRERYDDAEKLLENAHTTMGDSDVSYALAAFYESRGQRDKADALLVETIERDPEKIESYLKLSVFRGRAGDLKGATDAVDQALQVDAKNALARLRRAELLLDQRATIGPSAIEEVRAIATSVREESPALIEGIFVESRLQMVEGDFTKAEEGLRLVTRQRPNSAPARLMLASTLRQIGRRGDARLEVTRALEIDASLIPARRLLAQLHAELGDHQRAVQEARQVLRRAPGDQGMRLLAAQSLVRLGERDAARDELLAIPEAERSPDLHFALARLDLQNKDPKAARENLIRALDARPTHPGILGQYLGVERALGNPQAGLARIEAAVQAEPENGALARLRGMGLLANNRVDDAEKALRQAIELAPNDLRSYQALARYYFVTRRFDQGVATYEKAIEQEPKSASLRFALGSLYEVAKRRSEAITQYEEASRIDPKMAVAKNNLAYLLADEGKELDRALDLAREAKQLLPDSANTTDTLGYVLYKKGRFSSAIDFFREAENVAEPASRELGLIQTHLAMAYEKAGETENARETATRALNAIPAGTAAEQEPGWAKDLRALQGRL